MDEEIKTIQTIYAELNEQQQNHLRDASRVTSIEIALDEFGAFLKGLPEDPRERKMKRDRGEQGLKPSDSEERKLYWIGEILHGVKASERSIHYIERLKAEPQQVLIEAFENRVDTLKKTALEARKRTELGLYLDSRQASAALLFSAECEMLQWLKGMQADQLQQIAPPPEDQATKQYDIPGGSLGARNQSANELPAETQAARSVQIQINGSEMSRFSNLEGLRFGMQELYSVQVGGRIGGREFLADSSGKVPFLSIATKWLLSESAKKIPLCAEGDTVLYLNKVHPLLKILNTDEIPEEDRSALARVIIDELIMTFCERWVGDMTEEEQSVYINLPDDNTWAYIKRAMIMYQGILQPEGYVLTVADINMLLNGITAEVAKVKSNAQADQKHTAPPPEDQEAKQRDIPGGILDVSGQKSCDIPVETRSAISGQIPKNGPEPGKLLFTAADIKAYRDNPYLFEIVEPGNELKTNAIEQFFINEEAIEWLNTDSDDSLCYGTVVALAFDWYHSYCNKKWKEEELKLSAKPGGRSGAWNQWGSPDLEPQGVRVYWKKIDEEGMVVVDEPENMQGWEKVSTEYNNLLRKAAEGMKIARIIKANVSQTKKILSENDAIQMACGVLKYWNTTMPSLENSGFPCSWPSQRPASLARKQATMATAPSAEQQSSIPAEDQEAKTPQTPKKDGRIKVEDREAYKRKMFPQMIELLCNGVTKTSASEIVAAPFGIKPNTVEIKFNKFMKSKKEAINLLKEIGRDDLIEKLNELSA